MTAIGPAGQPQKGSKWVASRHCPRSGAEGCNWGRWRFYFRGARRVASSTHRAPVAPRRYAPRSAPRHSRRNRPQLALRDPADCPRGWRSAHRVRRASRWQLTSCYLLRSEWAFPGDSIGETALTPVVRRLPCLVKGRRRYSALGKTTAGDRLGAF